MLVDTCKILKFGALTVSALAFSASLAHAAPLSLLPATVSVSGDTTFDDGSSFGGSGGFSLVSGGVTTTSTYDGSTVTTGSNPLAGSFTAIGDGTGFNGTASETDAEFLIGFDTTLTAVNNGEEAYEVKIRLDWSNLVDATGSDAFADSEIFLEDDDGELFFTDIKSDTLEGNEVAGELTGGFGGELSESGVESFVYLLDPGQEVNLYLSWTLDGGEFGTDGIAKAKASASLTVVPVPAAAWLFGSALMGLLAMRRRKTLRSSMH